MKKICHEEYEDRLKQLHAIRDRLNAKIEKLAVSRRVITRRINKVETAMRRSEKAEKKSEGTRK